MEQSKKEDLKEENEKKKKYLWEYKRAKEQQERVEDDIKALRIDKMCPSLIYDGMPRGSSQHDLSDYAVKIDRLIKKQLKKRYRKVMIRQEIRNKIERLSDEREKDVLTYRYIFLMDWTDICKKTGYSWQHTHRIHSNALKNFKM